MRHTSQLKNRVASANGREAVGGLASRARIPRAISDQNWGYEIPQEQQLFARTLIDRADVSIIHGHSSHHAKAIEVYKNRLILYGCGDFLNDYEGIRGYEEYRGDLAPMFFADLDPATRNLVALQIIPLQIRKCQLVHPSMQDIDWMQQTLDRESLQFGTRVLPNSDGRLVLSWSTPGRQPGECEMPDASASRDDVIGGADPVSAGGLK